MIGQAHRPSRIMRRSLVAVVMFTVASSACRSGDGEVDSPRGGNIGTVMKASADQSMRPLASGDVRIVAEADGIDLALIGDTVSSGLSQKALAKAREGTDTNAVQGSGFGASIEKMVKGTVQSALGTRVGFPLSDIRGARYENGKIAFDWVGKDRSVFGDTKINKKPLLESFSAEDSQRFVEAVNTRKNRAVAR